MTSRREPDGLGPRPVALSIGLTLLLSIAGCGKAATDTAPAVKAPDADHREMEHLHAHDEVGHAPTKAEGRGRDGGHEEDAEGMGWCSEHAVPSAKCTKCKPKLVEAFKVKGDWCGEHGFPESVCPVCNPAQPPLGQNMGGLQVSPRSVARAGIKIIHGRQGPLANRLDLPAEVRFNPDRVAHISVLAAGQVVEVKVSQGDKVKKDQVVAVVRSVEIGRARAAYSKAKAQVSAASKALSRQRRLRSNGINAARDLIDAQLAVARYKADLQAARAELSVYGVSPGAGSSLVVRAPFDGVVVSRHATCGEFVTQKDELFKIADTGQVWVIGKAYDRHMDRLAVGAPAKIRLDAYADRTWTGKASFVSPAVDERTRTVDVRVVLDNPTGELRSGLFGTMVLTAAPPTVIGTVLPAAAVQPHDGMHVIFVPGDHTGDYKVRPVKVLRRGRGQVEVEGVKPADSVVGAGAFILKSELVKGSLADSCGGH